MESSTENLQLPFLMPSQAQKHVTHNEALMMLDALVQLGVESGNLSAPPPEPRAGGRWIVSAHASGVWSGRDGQIAAWQDGAWQFYEPRPGWLALALDESRLLAFDGTGWAPAVAQSPLPDRLGINAAAEAPNRLALAGEASLFTHEGAGHQLKINKARSADTASLLFQTDWAGRAEFGLTGDDDFHIKIRDAGDDFRDALVIDRLTARASFPAGIVGVREQLTAHRTYYVATGGSNAHDGLTRERPFATVQRAVDEAHRLDCSIYNVTIRLAPGSYSGSSVSRPLFGGGTLFILGNENSPHEVVLSSGTAASNGARVSISGVRFAMAAEWQNAITYRDGAQVTLGKVDFGPCQANGAHIAGSRFGSLTFEQDYRISGGATRHLALSGPVMVSGSNRTITLVDTPHFTSEFFQVSASAVVDLWNLSIAGGATGKRFTLSTTAIINLYGKPIDFLPGASQGTISTGAIYT